mgnify:CR=1 FL=1
MEIDTVGVVASIDWKAVLPILLGGLLTLVAALSG